MGDLIESALWLTLAGAVGFLCGYTRGVTNATALWRGRFEALAKEATRHAR